MTNKIIKYRLLSAVLAFIIVFSCSALVSLAEQETPAYRLVGIENGDTVIVNESFGNTVTVIDSTATTNKTVIRGNDTHNGVSKTNTVVANNRGASATNVSEVIFYINDEVVASDAQAPYTYTLPVDKLGENRLKVEVYDTSSGKTTFERTYNAVRGAAVNSWSENFEGATPVIPTNAANTPPDGAGITWTQDIATHNGSKALHVKSGDALAEGATVKSTPTSFALLPESFDATCAMNRLFFEFDYGFSYKYEAGYQTTLAFNNKYEYDNHSNGGTYGGIIMPFTTADYPSTARHFGIDLSWDNTTGKISYKMYYDGVEYIRDTANYSFTDSFDPTKFIPVLSHSATYAKVNFYIDNIRVTSYIDSAMVITDEPDVKIYDAIDTLLTGLVDIDADSAAYLTVDLPGGVDASSLNDNITLTDTVTSDSVPVTIDGNKIIFEKLLKKGTTYDLTLSTLVKTSDGKSYLADKTVSFSTKASALVADRAVTGFGASTLPLVGASGTVTFNAKIIGTNFTGKTVNVVVAVYDGNNMTALVVSPQIVTATGELTPVSITIDEMKEGMVAEAFIVDNMNDMNSVTEQVYTLK